MQALLIATGDTQKLKPLTERIPSPMIPVINRPIMLYNLELLGRLGFKRILVSVYTMGSAIEGYFGDGQKWGLSLDYILQREMLGSAGTLRLVKHQLREAFIVMPADVITNLEIAQAIQQHIAQKSQATVIVQPGPSKGDRALLADTSGNVLAFGGDRTDRTPAWTDTGIYLFDPQILNLIPQPRPFEIHQHLLPLLLSEGIPVRAYPIPGYWNPLDTLQDYAEAQYVFLSKALRAENLSEKEITYQYHSVDTRQVAKGVWVGRNVKIDPDVKMIAPVSVGHNTWIRREVELGPNAVIGSDVVIDEGATVLNSTIFDHTYVGKLVNLENRLVNQNHLIDLRTSESILVDNSILLGKANSKYVALWFKRSFDCLLAFLLILISLPISLIICLLLLLSTGKIFKVVLCKFPQGISLNRYPGKKETFALLHFHTHRKDGEHFWFGSWLESWEGERLPELINVLGGDLAMVGLKPVLAGMESSSYPDWWIEQDEVPGGFSGLWYVQTDSGCPFEEDLIADAYYLATRSWISDWKILLSTPAAWYRRTRKRSIPKVRILRGADNGSEKPVGG